MAKPDCNDGYYKKSIELEAALDFAGFTKIARTILRYTFAQIFGEGRRPRHAIIECRKIAQRIGKEPTKVYRALDELCKSNVLVPVSGIENAYRFVKDYDRWTHVARFKCRYIGTEIPRLSDTEKADCANSVAYASTFSKPHNPSKSVPNIGDTPQDGVPNIGDKADVGVPQIGDTPQNSVPPIGDKTDVGVPPIGDTPQNSVPNIGDTAFEGDEPFHPGTNDAPGPANHPVRQEARPMHSYILKLTTSHEYPVGRPDIADHAADMMATWLDQGYPELQIRQAFSDAIKAGACASPTFLAASARKRLFAQPPAPSTEVVFDSFDHYVARIKASFSNRPSKYGRPPG